MYDSTSKPLASFPGKLEQQPPHQSCAQDRSDVCVLTIVLGHTGTSGGRDARRSFAATTLRPLIENIIITYH